MNAIEEQFKEVATWLAVIGGVYIWGIISWVWQDGRSKQDRRDCEGSA